MLSQTDRSRLQAVCNSRLSWSDGGHWIGGGPEPDCLQSASLKGSTTITYDFPTDQAAFQWNAAREENIRYLGHVATVVVTVVVAIATKSPRTSTIVGMTAGIGKDELQASVPYPRVARGWKHILVVSHCYRWSPHPWGKNAFTKR